MWSFHGGCFLRKACVPLTRTLRLPRHDIRTSPRSTCSLAAWVARTHFAAFSVSRVAAGSGVSSSRELFGVSLPGEFFPLQPVADSQHQEAEVYQTAQKERIYDLAAKQQSAGLPGTRQALLKKLIGVESVSSLSVHPSGSQLLVGGENSKLYFFDLELSKRVFKVFRAHKHAISSVAFHQTLPLMASSSMDGTVQVYHCRVYDDLMTNPLIVPVKTLKVCADATQGGGVTTCFWHPTLPWLFTGDRTGACSLWR
ncbi:ribosome biogenesis protein bop1 [Cyclospora cayetanensis]|uniref:Ribosome biogenesis protein bop1 n=1 Tax=Cyclospora cayetanensis TaxID=88456 RepID=A0A1D3D5Z0_9EIME|nr:ribosome biogenesis protein bop1 [Cyclospora cayetanensis]